MKGLRRLRRRLHRLTQPLRAFYRAQIAPRVGWPLYGLSWRLAGALLGSARVQRLLMPARAAEMARFLRQTGLDAQHTPAAALRRYLLEHGLAAAYYRQLNADGPAAAVEARIVVDGWPHVAQAQAAGRGTLFVLSHYGLTRAFIAYMARRGFNGPVLRMQAGTRMKAAGVALTPQNQLLQTARDLAAAQQALAAGGSAMIVADGGLGRAGVTRPFYGQQRLFRTGFAELALISGAAVLPVSAVTDDGGRLLITIFPPLAVPDGPHAAQVAALIAQYADHLAALWARSPGSVQRNHIQHYLAPDPRIYAAPPAADAP